MKSEQCCGPRDALLVGLGKRMPKVPIGLIEKCGYPQKNREYY